jgi:alpha-tubulin suppressor-like RCC1 family protein
MSTFGGSFLDILSFGTSKRRTNSDIDGAFIDMIKQYPDIWREAFTGDNVLCCPASISLGEESSREQLMSHILIPDRMPGEYVTLRGEKVYVSGNELLCGVGFTESRKVKILTIGQLNDSNGKTTTVFRLGRPLVGGILAPEEADEVSLSTMFKFVAILRSFPEAESAFFALDEYLKEVNFVGRQSKSGFNRITPSLASSMEAQWKKTTERLVRANAISATLSNDLDTATQQLGHVIESYMMHNVAGTIYPWICEQFLEEDDAVLSVLEKMQHCSQTDLGIRPELQCSQQNAIDTLCTLGSAETPVDKLLVLKNTISSLREAVDRNVRRNFPGADVEMATDDIVLLVIWIVTQTYPYYKQLPADIRYISEFHFISSSKSQLGFNLCHFQVAMTWFLDRSIIFLDNKREEYFTNDEPNIVSDDIAEENISNHDNTSDYFETTLVIPSSICHETAIANASWVESVALNYSEESIDKCNKSNCTGGGANNVYLLGRDDRSFPGGIPSIVSIISERTNKSGPIVALAGASGYFAAINVDGNAYTWGSSDSGRLGKGLAPEMDLFLPIPKPTQVWGFGHDVRVKHLACGKSHMLAVTEAGELFSWGDNRCGQLGLHTSQDPIDVIYVDTVGSPVRGGGAEPLSNQKSKSESSTTNMGPSLVTSLSHVKVKSVACGAYHSLCLTADGKVYSWGRCANGRLGQFSSSPNVPDHAVGRPGLVRCNWKVNRYECIDGEYVWDKEYMKKARATNLPIPNKQQQSIATPTKLRSSSSSSPRESSKSINQSVGVKIVGIAAGFSHSIAITECGAVFTWGCGVYGRLGHGGHCDESLPKQIKSLAFNDLKIVSMSAGLAHTLFLSSNGLLFGCGLNIQGQVGSLHEIKERIAFDKYDNSSILVPRPIVFNSVTTYSFNNKGNLTSEMTNIHEYTKIKNISCGDTHSIATSIDGQIYLWGTCKIPINHLQNANNTIEDKEITLSAESDKIDISKLLSLSPIDIKGAGNMTLLIA